MSPLRKVFASLFIAGTLTVSGVACSSSGDSSKSSDASISSWCKKFEKAEKDETEAGLEDPAKAFSDLAKDAPAEIKDDMQAIATAFSETEDLDVLDDDAVAEFEETFDEEKLEGTTDRIEAFVKDKCGFDLDED